MAKKRTSSNVADLVPMSQDDRRAAMQKVASEMKGWRPARQVLRKVEAVPTIFLGHDQKIRVGGVPIGRVIMEHGPSGDGKTILALGYELSFLQGNHFVGHVDAEHTTAISWCEKLMAQYADHPGYVAMRPTSFEDTVDAVRSFLDNVGEAKAKGVVPPDTMGIIPIDSIRKLIPKNLLKSLLKDGAGKAGVDGMRGRGAQVRAALNSQWLDELIPHLHDTGCTLLLIARETEDPEADANDRKYGRDFRIGGGKALIYDSSVVMRVEAAGWIYQGSEEERNVVGQRHRVRIWKTKVAGRDDKVTDWYFHTSNGKLCPEGFDLARDAVEVGREMGIVEEKGAWFAWDGNKWNGVNQAVVSLNHNPAKLAALQAQIRSGFVIEGQLPEEELEQEPEEQPEQEQVVQRRKKR